jgi:hypothetical protein
MGRIVSESTKIKLRIAGTGRYVSDETRKKLSLALKGRVPSKQCLDAAHKAVTGRAWSDEERLQASVQRKGRKIKGHKGQRVGEKAPNWKGGITPIGQVIRHGEEYVAWRMSVFERDKFTCQICGQKGGELHAHHLWSFADHEDLRFVVDNGITVCAQCHRVFHKAFGNGNNTPDEWALFVQLKNQAPPA